jgi:probable F420-dependent oxidoreductase
MSGVDVTFNLQASPRDAASWRALVRRAEADGYGALLVADHPGATPAPFVALAAAAGVSERLRLGSYVLNMGVRNVLHTAIDVATLDVVSGGRAVLGVGAGHTPSEWATIGLERPGARDRVERCIDAIGALRALLAGSTVDAVGLHEARIDVPSAVQEPVPLLVGGNNSRLLAYAAAHAEVVAMTGLGRTLADGHSHEVLWTPRDVVAHFDLVRDEATASDREPVIDALVQHVELTDDARGAAERVAAELSGIDADDLLAAPFVLIGTAREIADELARHRARLGITSWTVRPAALDAIAEVRAVLGA